jgi:hypothetical protein
MAGICAAKTLVQHHCERFHGPDNVLGYIPSAQIHYRLKYGVQEILMHMCLLSLLLNAFMGQLLTFHFNRKVSLRKNIII